MVSLIHPSSGLWSPPGGRFKKEVLVDGQSHLLLIREEAGPPDAQVRERKSNRVEAPPSLQTLPDISLLSFFPSLSSSPTPAFLFLLFLSSSFPLQFSSWVDAVLLVFSLENEASFLELYQLFSQLNASRSDLPIIVVGTQGQCVCLCVQACMCVCAISWAVGPDGTPSLRCHRQEVVFKQQQQKKNLWLLLR